MSQFSVMIAGSTQHTQLCAASLAADDRFRVSGIITPPPKPVGRKQELVTNPLHQFALEQELPIVHVEKRIDAAYKHELEKLPQPDFLLVVDFGYIIPDWLLAFPKTAPINIHPSLLPRWRGSSPGQFVLLYGEKESAVSVIVMNDKLDQGPIVAQLPFTVSESWTQQEYYLHAFTLVAKQLPEILVKYEQQPEQVEVQPLTTPTPIASRFTKEDGYIPWELLTAAQTGTTATDHNQPLSPILAAALSHHQSIVTVVVQALKALTPWPGIWTIIPTAKGDKRMKILAVTAQDEKLILETVQIEGKAPTPWHEVKNILQ